MREVMPVRRELGVRTIFNLLGPLTNPAGARRQVMGVYAPELVEVIARVQAELGSEHAWVVHGDGLDEITTTGTTHVGEVRGGEVRMFSIAPEEVGLRRARLQDLLGGEPAENAVLMRRVLDGEEGPLADVTALNAGAALVVAGVASDLADGLERARVALRSGAAAAKLEALRTFEGANA
jgi:anthranilate phosphoribosyltransferase